MSDKCVLVVGTTPDYVLKLLDKRPGSVCFLMDLAYRLDFSLEHIDPKHICFTDLEQFDFALRSITRHFQRFSLAPEGIACFDCESLLVAGLLADSMGLPFPESSAIALARNKFEARTIWRRAGIFSPHAALCSTLDETLAVFRTTGARDVVLKPISASGSELVFHCTSESGVEDSVRTMARCLAERQASRLFKPVVVDSGMPAPDPCKTWIVERFVSGAEFSCDFILSDGRIYPVRSTEKVMASDQTFGSVLAYLFPASCSGENVTGQLTDDLKTAAVSLGFTRGYFMADYIIHEGRPVIIELTPRPGGDCIPDLIETSCGFDILGACLDLACSRLTLPVNVPEPPGKFAGINLYAPSDGLISYLDTSRIQSLPWVKVIRMKKETGDIITLPPEDYDNRLIGYCIVRLSENEDITVLSQALAHHVRIITKKSFQWISSLDKSS